MKVKVFDLLQDQVDSGVRSGLQKAFKWGLLETPEDGALESAVDILTNYIMIDIGQYFEDKHDD